MSVVQTIPLGLLKAIYTYPSLFLLITLLSTVTLSPGKTFVPLSGIAPLILTLLFSIN